MGTSHGNLTIALFDVHVTSSRKREATKRCISSVRQPVGSNPDVGKRLEFDKSLDIHGQKIQFVGIHKRFIDKGSLGSIGKQHAMNK